MKTFKFNSVAHVIIFVPMTVAVIVNLLTFIDSEYAYFGMFLAMTLIMLPFMLLVMPIAYINAMLFETLNMSVTPITIFFIGFIEIVICFYYSKVISYIFTRKQSQ